MNDFFRKLAPLAALGTSVAIPAHAEPPMNVDDAGTLDKGGMKIEAALARDHKKRGGEMTFGFAPIEHLEVGLSMARTSDRAGDLSTRLRGTGTRLKWVPFQNDAGWSFGASFGYGRTRVDERSTPDKFTEEEHSLRGLASYRLESGQVLHLNLGRTRVRAQGGHDRVGTWGVGFEQPLVQNLKLTAEIFGAEHASPDKAIGLRYRVFEGFKVSGAVGRGNHRNFGQVGFAWEF